MFFCKNENARGSKRLSRRLLPLASCHFIQRRSFPKKAVMTPFVTGRCSPPVDYSRKFRFLLYHVLSALSRGEREKIRPKILGLCPKPCLGDFLRRSPLRTFKTLNHFVFLNLFLHGADFDVAIFRAANFGCSRAKSRPAGFWRLLPLSRYRVEVVGKLVGGLTERHTGRSLQTTSSGTYISKRISSLQGRNPQGAPRIPSRFPFFN